MPNQQIHSKAIFNQKVKELKDETNFSIGEIQSQLFILFKHFFQLHKTAVLADKIISIRTEDEEKFNRAIRQIKNNEPIQYITGKADFYGLEFKVNPSVLIPRPETEELVDLIINENKVQQKGLNLLDIGTGSGCIAICLAKELNQAKVSAIDISKDALKTAKENAVLNATLVNFIEYDILKYPLNPFPISEFDIIVSNPPYITQSEKTQMQNNVLDYEPHLALFVEDTSALIFYEKIDVGHR